MPLTVSDGTDSDSTTMLIFISRGNDILDFNKIPIIDVFKGRYHGKNFPNSHV